MKIKKSNKTELKDIVILTEVVLLASIISFSVMSLFNNLFLDVLEILMGILLIVFGFSNYKFANQKKLAFVYYLIGTLLIITTAWGLING